MQPKVLFECETSHFPPSPFQGSVQSNGKALRAKHNGWVHEAFDSPPPFYIAVTLTTGGCGLVCAWQHLLLLPFTEGLWQRA